MRAHDRHSHRTARRSAAATLAARATVMLAGAALFIGLGAGPALAAPVKLPAYTKTRLANGLTVLVMPSQRLPLVHMRMMVDAGAVNDPTGKEGLASLTAELLTQGAGPRGAKQIAEDIAFVGGELGASAGAERTTVSCEVLRKDFAVGLELLRDCVVSPAFPGEEFQRKKEEAVGAIASQQDDPGSVADRALYPFLMGENPLAHPPLGWKGSVEGLAREDIVAFHAQRFTPDRAVLAVVGDVDAKRVVAALEKAFAGWRRGAGGEAASYAPLARSAGRRVLIVSKPEVTQTQIRLACASVPRNHPDYYPMMVANTVLGAGFTSRLVNEIRVVQGLTYSIGSRFNLYRRTGTFGVSTFSKNETLRKCIDETIKVVKTLVDQGPSAEELAKVKRYLTGQFPLGLQAPESLAQQILDIEFFGLDPKYVETFSDRIEAVTMDEARRALATHFCVDDLRILVVSEPEMAKRALDGLGPIEVGEVR